MNEATLTFRIEYPWKFDWPESLPEAVKAGGIFRLRLSPGDAEGWEIWGDVFVSPQSEPDLGHYFGRLPLLGMAGCAVNWLSRELGVRYPEINVMVSTSQFRSLPSVSLLSAEMKHMDAL